MEQIRVSGDNVTNFSLYDGQIAQAASIAQVKQKHKEEVLRTIYEKPGISQMDLGEAVGISASGLHAVIKKLNEVHAPPIRSRKAGKFRYYYLTDSGQKYVEELLEASDEEDMEKLLQEYWSLFREREDYNKDYGGLLKTGMTAEAAEEQSESLFLTFAQFFLDYYQKTPDGAVELLGKLVDEKELYGVLLEHAARSMQNNINYAELTGMLERDCELAYRYVDDVFDKCILESAQLEAAEYGMRDRDAFGNLTHELESAVLHAVMQDMQKIELSAYWMEQGIDRQLAYYMAEKFRGVKAEVVNRYRKLG